MADIFDDLFLHLFTMMLIAFKLTNFLDWSWWIVCAPSIIGFLLYLLSHLSSE
jgi:hypothetical protein